MIIDNKNSNHVVLIDSVSISTTGQVKTIYDMTTKKAPQKEAFPENE
jgi:hypothetical protein